MKEQLLLTDEEIIDHIIRETLSLNKSLNPPTQLDIIPKMDWRYRCVAQAQVDKYLSKLKEIVEGINSIHCPYGVDFKNKLLEKINEL